MDEVSRLKKIIENRDSTIVFLNDLLDGQSRKIEELENRLSDSEADYTETVQDSFIIDGLKEENENLKGYNCYLLDRFNEVCKLNDKLNSKLSILLNAFNEIKEDDVVVKDDDTPKKKVSDEKKQHVKELASPKWKKKREEVFERYGKQCVECGSTKNIQVHHLIYRKGHHLWEYNVDELIPLCKKCHQKIHDDKTHRFHEKYTL